MRCNIPWTTSICLSLLQCMIPLPKRFTEADGSFLAAIFSDICTIFKIFSQIGNYSFPSHDVREIFSMQSLKWAWTPQQSIQNYKLPFYYPIFRLQCGQLCRPLQYWRLMHERDTGALSDTDHQVLAAKQGCSARLAGDRSHRKYVSCILHSSNKSTGKSTASGV